MLNSSRVKVGLIFIAVVTSYWQIFHQYYQQDEWHHFGVEFVWHSVGFLEFMKNYVLDFHNIHFAPITNLVNYFQFSLLGLRSQSYALVALILHFINCVLLLFVLKKIFKNEYLAYVASLLFATSIVDRQAVTWLLQYITTLPALTFSLLSILFANNYFVTNNKKWFILSIVFMIIALGFKETALFLGAFLPIYWLIFFYPRIQKILFPVIVILVVISYSIFRFMVLPQDSLNKSSVSSGSLKLNILTITSNGVTQSFFPQDLIMELSKKLAKFRMVNNMGFKPETNEYDEFINFKLAPKVTVALSLGLLMVVGFLFLRSKYQKEILIGLAFIFTGVMPFMMLPQVGEFNFLSSRYLYIPAVGSNLIIALFLLYLSKKYYKISYALVLFLVLLNIFVGWRMFIPEIKEADIRRGILEKIEQAYPTLPDDVIFYTESDASYYGLPEEERIFPFQSGFGHTLLVSYQSKENFPVEYFKNDYLWNIKDQGYQKIDNRGFGYFRDFNRMMDTLKTNNLSNDSVVSFRYDSSNNSIFDTTEEVRGRIKGYLTKKKKISTKEYVVSASNNQQDIANISDEKRETFWDSKLPYARSQYIEIDLTQKRMLAQITLDSYNNKDQNAVGYAVWLSDDKSHWKNVFYSKRYTPNKEGTVNIYFLPQFAQFIKIEQIGSHKFADWIIHELSLYETTE